MQHISQDELSALHALARAQADPSSVTTLQQPVIAYDECPWQRGLLERAIQKRPKLWLINRDSPLSKYAIAQIDEYEAIEWNRVLAPPYLTANAYCVRKGLTRKAQLAQQIHKYLTKHPDSILASTVPVTIILNTYSLFHESHAMFDRQCAIEEAFWELREEIDAWELNPHVPAPECIVDAGPSKVLVEQLVDTQVTQPIKQFTAAQQIYPTNSGNLQSNTMMMEPLELPSDPKCELNNDVSLQLNSPAEMDVPKPVSSANVSFGASSVPTQTPDADILTKDAPATISQLKTQVEARWIMKPSIVNKAAAIRLIRTVEEAQEHVGKYQDISEWVVQRYIPQPLLLGGRKFHLRVYVLAIGAMSVYVYREALALAAASFYKDTLKDSAMNAHITNTCFAKECNDFNEDECVQLLSELRSLPSSAFSGSNGCISSCETGASNTMNDGGSLKSMDGQEIIDIIYERIRHVVANTFHAMRGEFNVFQPLKNGFELFGVDFVVDEHLTPFLLEFNPGPDLKQTGERLKYFIEDMLDEMVDLTLTPLTSSSSLEDLPSNKIRKRDPTQLPGFIPHDVHSNAGWDQVYSDNWPVPQTAMTFSE